MSILLSKMIGSRILTNRKEQATILLVLILLALMLLTNERVFAEDIFSTYKLPPLKRAPTSSSTARMLKNAKVLNYAETLPVHYSEIAETDLYASRLKSEIQNRLKESDNFQNIIKFEGKNSQELNLAISRLDLSKKIELLLTAPEIIIDQPIILKNNLKIKGHPTRLSVKNLDFAIIAQNVSDTALEDIVIDRALVCGLMLINTKNSIIKNIAIVNGGDKGIVVRKNSSFISIEGSRFENNRRGAIEIEDASHHISVSNCDISGGTHSSNWAAGIVITSAASLSDFGIREVFNKDYFYPKELNFNKDDAPYSNLIEKNSIHDNQSSGIYLDGANGTVVSSNSLNNNDKEGLCLDFHATANLIEKNIFSGNGFRRKQSDNDLRLDEVLNYGKLANGSSVSKLPNISLDNTAYNIIINNIIKNSAGEGIKIVRSGFRNIFGMNTILSNNVGENHVFKSAGILFGSAGFNNKNTEKILDPYPSIENIIFKNVVDGAHASGILLDPGSVYNDIIENVIVRHKGKAIVQRNPPNNYVRNSIKAKSSFPQRTVVIGLILVLLVLIIIKIRSTFLQ